MRAIVYSLNGSLLVAGLSDTAYDPREEDLTSNIRDEGGTIEATMEVDIMHTWESGGLMRKLQEHGQFDRLYYGYERTREIPEGTILDFVDGQNIALLYGFDDIAVPSEEEVYDQIGNVADVRKYLGKMREFDSDDVFPFNSGSSEPADWRHTDEVYFGFKEDEEVLTKEETQQSEKLSSREVEIIRAIIYDVQHRREVTGILTEADIVTKPFYTKLGFIPTDVFTKLNDYRKSELLLWQKPQVMIDEQRRWKKRK